MRNEGKLVENSLTIDQSKSVEMKYVTGLKGEIYMDMPGQTTISSGYGFNEGKLTLYTGLPMTLSFIEDNLDAKGLDVYPIIVGYSSTEVQLRNAIGLMPYTVFSLKDKKAWKDLNGKSIFSIFDETNDSLRPKGWSGVEIDK